MSLTFGEKIKEARKIHGLTQKQLANKIGAAHNSISDWENNKNKPDSDTIELLCETLEITPNYLLASISEDFSPVEKLIIEKYRSLDLRGKKMVNYILDRESERIKECDEHIRELGECIKERDRQIKELERRPAAIMEFPVPNNTGRLLEYFRNTSA